LIECIRLLIPIKQAPFGIRERHRVGRLAEIASRLDIPQLGQGHPSQLGADRDTLERLCIRRLPEPVRGGTGRLERLFQQVLGLLIAAGFDGLLRLRKLVDVISDGRCPRPGRWRRVWEPV
jgi:hypothetical protein